MATRKKVPRPRATRALTRAADCVPARSELLLLCGSKPKNDALVGKVRNLALKQQQRSKPRAFLSVRDAAEAFKVSVSTMAGVYRRLSQEGLLSSVRGSGTMLRGKSTGRTLSVKGMIGIPVSVRRFLMLRDYRDCFLHLRDELFSRGFATRCVFFEDRDGDASFLVSRFARAEVDTILCILPDGSSHETSLRVRDRGFQFIGVSLRSTPDVFCRYQVRRRQAIGAIFRHWRHDGKIRIATVLRAQNETAADTARMKRLESLAAAERIECEFTTLLPGDLRQSVAALCTGRDCAVVVPSPAASVLAWREPDAVSDVLAACRVALVDGPIDVPVTQQWPGAAADIVTVDWRPIAERIAADVTTGRATAATDPVGFEAKPLLRVSLEKLIHRR